MEKKVKCTVALAILTIVLGAFYIMPSAIAAEELASPESQGGLRDRWVNRFWLIGFLKKGVPSELEATIVALEGNILVVEIDGETVNINMPRKWLSEGVATDLASLFDGDPFEMGDIITLQTLVIQLVRETHTVTAYFCYKLDGEVSATAILPFNINAT